MSGQRRVSTHVHARDGISYCSDLFSTIVPASSKPSFIVVGARSPPSTFESAKKMGKQVLTELQYVAMVLGESLNTTPVPAGVQAGRKRPAEAEAGPSKPSKARKSDPGYPAAPDFPRVSAFLYGGEIRLEKKMLKAYVISAHGSQI